MGEAFKGHAIGFGDPEDLTFTQATALLDAVVGDSGSGGTKGLVPAPAAGDAAAEKFLKASGAWATTPATSLTDNSVTFAKMQDIATDRLIGRDTPGSGDPEEISVGGGLEFTGTAGIQRSALTGDVTASAGSGSTTIANDAVTNAKLANMANATVKARNTAGTGDPEDVTMAQLAVLLGTQSKQIVIRKFTSSGTYPTVTNGAVQVLAMVKGGGGGGGGGTTLTNIGGSGAEGATSWKLTTASALSGQTVTIGAGGTNVAANTDANGGGGGTSSIGTVVTAPGGGGGAAGPAEQSQPRDPRHDQIVAAVQQLVRRYL
jgi:hypothetical protein